MGHDANFSAVKTLRTRLEESIFGQEELLTEVLVTLLSGGHILMTGAPGLAKTTLVRVLARHLSLQFGRVQFTPDLLPSDILGSDILHVDPSTGRRAFEFARGPVFANLLLADEINRASPRTQSALLEAMQERVVTMSGQPHPLPRPFMVFATENPFESEGTFPLPEAQLDRFLLHSLVAYPRLEAEIRIITEHAASQLVGENLDTASANASPLHADDLIKMIQAVRTVRMPDGFSGIIAELVRSSRPDDELCPEQHRAGVVFGAGPRAGIALVSAAKALAYMEEENEVRWRHIERLAKPVMRHRLKMTRAAELDGITADRFIDHLVAELVGRHRQVLSGR